MRLLSLGLFILTASSAVAGERPSMDDIRRQCRVEAKLRTQGGDARKAYRHECVERARAERGRER